MPFKKKMYRRKRFGKKRTSKKRTTLVNVNRGLQPFASRYITKMKYSEVFNLNVANNYTQVMRLNSLFDPNFTGVGHQPYGYDQLSPIYNRYRVIACSYVINSYSSTNAIRFGCLPCNDIPPISNMSELVENPRARFKTQYPGGDTQWLKGKVSIPALMGRTKQQYMADDRFQAEVTTSPLEAALLFINSQRIDDGPIDSTICVTLEYTVEFFDPKPIDQS